MVITYFGNKNFTYFPTRLIFCSEFNPWICVRENSWNFDILVSVIHKMTPSATDNISVFNSRYAIHLFRSIRKFSLSVHLGETLAATWNYSGEVGIIEKKKSGIEIVFIVIVVKLMFCITVLDFFVFRESFEMSSTLQIFHVQNLNVTEDKFVTNLSFRWLWLAVVPKDSMLLFSMLYQLVLTQLILWMWIASHRTLTEHQWKVLIGNIRFMTSNL